MKYGVASFHSAAMVVAVLLPGAAGAQELTEPLSSRFAAAQEATILRAESSALTATSWPAGPALQVEADGDVSVGALLVFTPLATAAGEAAAVYMFAACLYLWCNHDPTMTYGIGLPISAAIAVTASTAGARSAGADFRRALIGSTIGLAGGLAVAATTADNRYPRAFVSSAENVAVTFAIHAAVTMAFALWPS